MNQISLALVRLLLAGPALACANAVSIPGSVSICVDKLTRPGRSCAADPLPCALPDISACTSLTANGCAGALAALARWRKAYDACYDGNGARRTDPSVAANCANVFRTNGGSGN